MKLFIVIVRAKNAAENFSLDEIVVCIFICYANPNYRYYYIELGNFIVVIFFFCFLHVNIKFQWRTTINGECLDIRFVMLCSYGVLDFGVTHFLGFIHIIIIYY